MWTSLDDPDEWTTALCVPETKVPAPALDRRDDSHLADEVERLTAELEALRSTVAYKARQLKRLRQYTEVLGPDGQIENAQRLYELMWRDARQIGQDLALLVPASRGRQPSAAQS